MLWSKYYDDQTGYSKSIKSRVWKNKSWSLHIYV
jgi:hypothetical protein